MESYQGVFSCKGWFNTFDMVCALASLCGDQYVEGVEGSNDNVGSYQSDGDVRP